MQFALAGIADGSTRVWLFPPTRRLGSMEARDERADLLCGTNLPPMGGRASDAVSIIGGGPPVLGADQEVIQRLRDSVEWYRSCFVDHASLVRASRPSDLELILGIVAPFLFAIGVALRITKVTGELRLETQATGVDSSDASSV